MILQRPGHPRSGRLVSADSTPSAIQTELTRLKPGRIAVLGGVNAVSNTVSQQLISYISK